MRKWTVRQLRAASEWMRRRWNEPSRTDRYLTQLTCEVVRNRLKPEAMSSVQPSDYVMEFETRTEAELRQEKAEADLRAREAAKQSAIAFATRRGKVPIEHRRVPRE